MCLSHHRIFSIFFVLSVLASVGCEGRHIDTSRRLRNSGLEDKPESAPPPSSEDRTDASIVRADAWPMSTTKSAPVFRASIEINHSDFNRSKLMTFYIDADNGMRLISDNSWIGDATCLVPGSATAAGDCEKYDFHFDPQADLGSLPMKGLWSAGETYRLIGRIDDQSAGVEWGLGRIEESSMMFGQLPSTPYQRLVIRPQASATTPSPLVLSEPVFLFFGQTDETRAAVQYAIAVPYPRTDLEKRVISVLGLDESTVFSGREFILKRPATASFSMVYRRLADDFKTALATFTLERVEKRSAP